MFKTLRDKVGSFIKDSGDAMAALGIMAVTGAVAGAFIGATFGGGQVLLGALVFACILPAAVSLNFRFPGSPESRDGADAEE